MRYEVALKRFEVASLWGIKACVVIKKLQCTKPVKVIRKFSYTDFFADAFLFTFAHSSKLA